MAAALRAAAAARGLAVDLETVHVTTTGDRVSDRPYEAIGRRGIFAHELQRALLDERVDVAVHSLKDLPAPEPDGLAIAAVPVREDARDVLVSRDGSTLDALPAGAVVGTASSRRRALLAVLRPDLEVVVFRGNVDTRLAKVERGDVDATVLAAAGLRRLGRADAVSEWLDPSVFVPAPGQGALAVEVRAERLSADLSWLADLDDEESSRAVRAERAFSAVMEGGCEVPLGAYAEVSADGVTLRAFVASPDGSDHVRGELAGDDASSVGRSLAERLLAAGADRLVAGRRR